MPDLKKPKEKTAEVVPKEKSARAPSKEKTSGVILKEKTSKAAPKDNTTVVATTAGNKIKRKASTTLLKHAESFVSNGEEPKPKLARSASMKIKKTEVEKKEENNNDSKEKRPKASISRMSTPAKRIKIAIEPNNNKPGKLFMFGMGDLYQLGIHAQCTQRKFPCLVEDLENVEIIDVAAGGLHTVVLTQAGKVLTFGCNDEKALGRKTEVPDDPDATDELNKTPTEIKIPNNPKIVQITAGDSHSAALTEDGNVYIWGTFRGGNGVIGLLADTEIKLIDSPQLIEFKDAYEAPRIVKISSGYHHLVMLDDTGLVYTMGSSEQGQLGRNQTGNLAFTSLTLRSKSRAQLLKTQEDYELTPSEVKFQRNLKMSDIFASGFATFCKGKVESYYAFGLNNFGQLGIDLKWNLNNCIFAPKLCTSFKGIPIYSIACGEHHTLILSKEGEIFGLGRAHNGRLGLGLTELDHTLKPMPIRGEIEGKVSEVRAGLAVSYAINEEGKLYAWGFGTNWQLAQGHDNDVLEPKKCFADIKKNLIQARSLLVSGGGQHVGLILERGMEVDDE